jgi:hypothetical protein
MLLIAVVSGLVATLPVFWAQLRAKAALKQRQAELALEELNRKEAARLAAEKAEAARGALEKARKAEAESTVALQGAASTNQAGATSGGPSTPDGGRGVQTDPLSKMKDQILQGIGRK